MRVKASPPSSTWAKMGERSERRFREERFAELARMGGFTPVDLDKIIAFLASETGMPYLELGRCVPGIECQLCLELLLCLGERLGIVRFEQESAAQAEMQVERAGVLRDRLAVFGGGFGEPVLRFEDLGRELVDPVRGGGLLEHAARHFVERLHVDAGGLIEHVCVVGILGFEPHGDRESLIALALGDVTLRQGEARETGKIGIGGVVEAVGQIGDGLGAMAGRGAREGEERAGVVVVWIGLEGVLQQVPFEKAVGKVARQVHRKWSRVYTLQPLNLAVLVRQPGPEVPATNAAPVPDTNQAAAASEAVPLQAAATSEAVPLPPERALEALVSTMTPEERQQALEQIAAAMSSGAPAPGGGQPQMQPTTAAAAQAAQAAQQDLQRRIELRLKDGTVDQRIAHDRRVLNSKQGGAKQ